MGTSHVVAVDIGGTSIKAVAVDADGRSSREDVRPTPVAAGLAGVVDAIVASAEAVSGSGPAAVAVVVPGAVDVASGVVRYAANLGWQDVPLRQLLTDRLGVPVALEHDVRTAGLAELAIGRGVGVRDCLVIVIGTGIAALVVSDGRPIGGAVNLAGELGHVPVWPSGERCACGQLGCLETYSSASAVARRYEVATGRATTAEAVVAARGTDPAAARVWNQATEALGIAIASYTLIADPALVVLSGGLSAAGDALLEPVRAELGRRVLWRPVPDVEASPLGARAGRYGAAMLAWQLVGRTDFTGWRVVVD